MDIQNNLPENEAPKEELVLNLEGKKEKKTLKKWPFIIAAAIIVVAVVIALLWKPIVSLFDKQDQKTIVDYEQVALSNLIDQFIDGYDSLVASERTGAVGTNCHIEFEIDQLALMVIKKEYPELEMLDILNKISLDASYENDGSRLRVLVSPNHEKAELPSAELQYDLDVQHLYIILNGINKDYLDFDVSKLSEELSSVQPMPDPDDVDVLLQDYLSDLLGLMNQENVSTERVSVDDVEQSYTVYSAQVNLKAFIELNIKLLDSLATLCGEDLPLGITILNRVAELEIMLNEVSDDDTLVWTDYVDDKDRIIGRRIEENNDVIFEYLYVRNKEKLAVSAACGIFEFVGSATCKNDEMNGRFVLYVNGVNYLEIKPDDIKIDDLEEGEIRGTARFTPSDRLLEDLLGKDLGLPLSFDVEFNITDEERKFAVNYMDMVEASFHITEYVPESISLPQGEAINGSASDALYRWLSGMDIQSLLDELKKAGLSDIFK